MTPTDEPEVTEETRFWLTSELHTTWYTHDRQMRSGQRHRIKYEVSEAAYRAAYAEATDQAPDITVPLDNHWWNSRQIPPYSSAAFGISIYRTHGGHIDWWAP